MKLRRDPNCGRCNRPLGAASAGAEVPAGAPAQANARQIGFDGRTVDLCSACFESLDNWLGASARIRSTEELTK